MPDADGRPRTLAVERVHFRSTFLGSGTISRNWGPTLRGGFGRALRNVACSLGRDNCKECPIGTICAYSYLFETPIAESATIMRKYTQAPHPFVFEPNEFGKPRVQEGDSVDHSLVVIGGAVRYLPYFFLAIERLGENGLGGDLVPFRVDRVVTADGVTLFEQPRRGHFDAAKLRGLLVEPGKSRTAAFQVVLQTPARITVNGRLAGIPTLPDVVRALARRVFLLRHFHCDGGDNPLSDDFVEAAKAAHCLDARFHWEDADRYSTRQQQRVPIGGIVGRLRCEGDFGLLEPLLRAGEYVHVGKNATFGLGKLAVKEGG